MQSLFTFKVLPRGGGEPMRRTVNSATTLDGLLREMGVQEAEQLVYDDGDSFVQLASEADFKELLTFVNETAPGVGLKFVHGKIVSKALPAVMQTKASTKAAGYVRKCKASPDCQNIPPPRCQYCESCKQVMDQQVKNTKKKNQQLKRDAEPKKPLGRPAGKKRRTSAGVRVDEDVSTSESEEEQLYGDVRSTGMPHRDDDQPDGGGGTGAGNSFGGPGVSRAEPSNTSSSAHDHGGARAGHSAHNSSRAHLQDQADSREDEPEQDASDDHTDGYDDGGTGFDAFCDNASYTAEVSGHNTGRSEGSGDASAVDTPTIDYEIVRGEKEISNISQPKHASDFPHPHAPPSKRQRGMRDFLLPLSLPLPHTHHTTTNVNATLHTVSPTVSPHDIGHWNVQVESAHSTSGADSISINDSNTGSIPTTTVKPQPTHSAPALAEEWIYQSLTRADGAIFVGYAKSTQPWVRRGKVTFGPGRTHTGAFEYDELHGQGTICDKQKSVFVTGEFCNGQPVNVTRKCDHLPLGAVKNDGSCDFRVDGHVSLSIVPVVHDTPPTQARDTISNTISVPLDLSDPPSSNLKKYRITGRLKGTGNLPEMQRMDPKLTRADVKGKTPVFGTFVQSAACCHYSENSTHTVAELDLTCKITMPLTVTWSETCRSKVTCKMQCKVTGNKQMRKNTSTDNTSFICEALLSEMEVIEGTVTVLLEDEVWWSTAGLRMSGDLTANEKGYKSDVVYRGEREIYNPETGQLELDATSILFELDEHGHSAASYPNIKEAARAKHTMQLEHRDKQSFRDPAKYGKYAVIRDYTYMFRGNTTIVANKLQGLKDSMIASARDLASGKKGYIGNFRILAFNYTVNENGEVLKCAGDPDWLASGVDYFRDFSCFPNIY